MDKKLNKIHKNLIPMKLKTMPYTKKCYNTIKHKHTYLITFLVVNNGYTSSCALIRLRATYCSNAYNIAWSIQYLVHICCSYLMIVKQVNILISKNQELQNNIP